MKQNRFKSWALWTSAAALIAYILKTFLRLDIAEEVDGLLNVLLPVLVAFGIVNDPTSKTSL